MIDRVARNYTLETIEQFMRGEITDFKFSRMLAEQTVVEGTDDVTIDLLDFMFLSYTESPEDKTFPHNRESWDFFNRARLLMASDAELLVTKKRKWSKWQAAALLAVLIFYPLFGYMIAVYGLEKQWGGAIFYAIIALCGGVVYWLTKQRQKEEFPEEPPRRYAETWPFPSHEEWLETKQRTPEFEEWKYPFDEDDPMPEKRSLMTSPIIWLFMPVIVCLWCLLSPFMLLHELEPGADVQMHLHQNSK